jgi:glucose-6-phosphate 1-dehydrogenase
LPPIVLPTQCRARNCFRFHVSPNVTTVFGLTVMDHEEKMIGEQVELLASDYSVQKRRMHTDACSATP